MKVDQGKRCVGRFLYQADLLLALTDLCRQENIRLGVFSVIGALTKAELGYYDQEMQKYVTCVSLDKKLEINSCLGNVSLKDEKIFVHAHVTLADHTGQCYGGHLMPGTMIYVAEYYLEELTGGELKRSRDQETGLSLWPKLL